MNLQPKKQEEQKIMLPTGSKMLAPIRLNEIYNEDCLEGMKRIPDHSVDAIICDPPYVLDNQGGGFFALNQDEYIANSKGNKAHMYGGERKVMKEISFMSNGITNSFLDEMCRVMKAINIYIFCSQKQIMQYLDYFVTKNGCNWNLLCWHKIDPIPACGNKYLSDSEYILFFREKGVRIYGDYTTKKTYYVTKANREDKKLYGHPTCKPVNIVKNFVINSTQEGQTILDPFMGSGTTAIACIREHRNFIGFELNKEYYDKACQRIKNEQAQPTLF